MQTSQMRAAFVGDDSAQGQNAAEHTAWPELRVAFYNIGIRKSEVTGKGWPKTKLAIARDMHHIFFLHKCDMLCLSEVGHIDEGLQQNPPRRRHSQIVQQPLAKRL